MDARTQIANAYQQNLGRAASAGELDWRVGQLRVRNLAGQLADIAGSGEANTYRTNQANAQRQAQENAWNQSLRDMAANQQRQFDEMITRQNQKQDGLFNQYKDTIGKQEKLPDMYRRLQEEQGIPELSKQAQSFKDEIYRVKGLLDRLDEDVTSRTQGTYTTEAMRNRIVASEGDPLRTNLARLGTGLQPVADMLTGAQGQLQALLPLYMQQQDRELRPLELEINSLSDRFAREITGFTSNKQTQLTVLLNEVERGRQLSDREWDLAQKLAAEEREFSRQKSLAAASASRYAPAAAAAPAAPAPTAVRQLPQVNNQPYIANVGVAQNVGRIGSVGVAQNTGRLTLR